MQPETPRPEPPNLIVSPDGEIIAEPRPRGLFKTDDPVEVIQHATRTANALADVIARNKLFTAIQGKNHVRVEGWQLLGSMLGVSAVCVATEPVEGGFKATVEARTVDGRVIGRADAICSRAEKRGPWKTADDYAILSMAQTRATSKALKGPLGFIVSLAGYETAPAEEMGAPASVPAQHQDISRLITPNEQAELTSILNAQDTDVDLFIEWASKHLGYEIKTIADLPQSFMPRVKDALRQSRERKAKEATV